MDLSDSEAVERRKHKRIPDWSRKDAVQKAYMQQKPINPDSIFGISVLKPDLSVLFPLNKYPQVHRQLAARESSSHRVRRDSLNWRHDRLTRSEIAEYEHRMGYTQRVEHLVYEYTYNVTTPSAAAPVDGVRSGVMAAPPPAPPNVFSS
eukprot:Filipodium_phascolosomae@DN1849_c0_g1_i3.p1